MRIIIQRVSQASVTIDGVISGQINQGFLLLIGIEAEDTQEDADWLVGKVSQMRIFSDENGKMNRSIQEVNGELLVISQFTLFASTKKGNRPSFIKAARPEIAIPLYEYLIQAFRQLGITTQTGEFGADMKVALVNDGPVTISIDSKNKE